MKIATIIVAVAAVPFLLAACSSSSDDEPSPPKEAAAAEKSETRVEGLYKRGEGGSSNIELIVFEPDGHYKMAIDDAARLDEGTFTINDEKTSVTFHSTVNGGRETTLDLAIGEGITAGESSGDLLKPKAGGLVNPGAGLVKTAGSVQLNGNGYQLVAFDYFCKDAALINPMSSNCSGVRGNCPAGKVTCIQYGPRRT